MSYSTEADLFNQALESTYINQQLAKKTAIKFVEPKGLFGIPDLLIASKDRRNNYYSIAFEMKLKNWTRALRQAYRYKSFSELSFVVMDRSNVGPALENLAKFKKSNIGLLSIDKNGRLYRHYLPQKDKPYFEQHKKKLKELILHANDEMEYEC